MSSWGRVVDPGLNEALTKNCRENCFSTITLEISVEIALQRN